MACVIGAGGISARYRRAVENRPSYITVEPHPYGNANIILLRCLLKKTVKFI